MTTELVFPVMDAVAHVAVIGGCAALAERAEQRLRDLATRWDPSAGTSELARINAAGGRWVRVTAETLGLADRALAARRFTIGRFDPLTAVNAQPVELSVSLAHRSVRVGIDTRFDPNTLTRALAADLVAEELIGAGATGACVNVGGNARVVGESLSGAGWFLTVDHPAYAEPAAVANLVEGGMATAFADAGRLAATVIAGRAWQAAALAVAALTADELDAHLLLAKTAARGLTVVDRRAVVVGGDEVFGHVAPEPRAPLDG